MFKLAEPVIAYVVEGDALVTKPGRITGRCIMEPARYDIEFADGTRRINLPAEYVRAA